MTWVVYLVQCTDKSLYCGITNNLEKRLEAHNLGKGAKYTRSRIPVELFGTSSEMTKSDALKLEHRVKMAPARRKRIELEKVNVNPDPENTQFLQEIQRELLSIVIGIQQLTDSVLNILAAFETPTQTVSSKGTKVWKRIWNAMPER